VSFLLDTNVVSELVRPRPNRDVTQWVLKNAEDSLFVSVLTLAELRFGIQRLVAGARRLRLEAWIRTEMQGRFEGRVISVDEPIANAWADLMAGSEAAGRRMAAMDCFLAATALVWDLTLVTRNTADFTSYGGAVFSPWESAS
jgi:toxin FitB